MQKLSLITTSAASKNDKRLLCSSALTDATLEEVGLALVADVLHKVKGVLHVVDLLEKKNKWWNKWWDE